PQWRERAEPEERPHHHDRYAAQRYGRALTRATGGEAGGGPSAASYAEKAPDRRLRLVWRTRARRPEGAGVDRRGLPRDRTRRVAGHPRLPCPPRPYGPLGDAAQRPPSARLAPAHRPGSDPRLPRPRHAATQRGIPRP